MSLLCRDQFLRIGKFGLLSLALVFVSYWHVPKSLAQQIRVVPSISVLEQYDSNVFFTPKSQLTAGTKADDLITTLTPQLNFMNNTNLLKANVSLGAVVQKFAHNSELDNVGFNASTGIDLSQAVNRVLPRMTALRVFGTYRYSPSTPAFGAGGLGGGVGGGGGFGMGGVGISGPVDSGLLAQRIRTTMYSVGLADSYSLSPTTNFQTTYMYSQLSFGGSYTPTSATAGQSSQTVFDTSTHSITAGPSSRITATGRSCARLRSACAIARARCTDWSPASGSRHPKSAANASTACGVISSSNAREKNSATLTGATSGTPMICPKMAAVSRIPSVAPGGADVVKATCAFGK